MLRSLGLVLLALGSFALTCALVRPAVPLPEASGRRDKWEWFDAHADELDAVFIGSSHVFRGVVPRVLEEELARRGIEFHAFNLGSSAVWSVEGDFWLRKVLERRPARLRWIFLETGFRRVNRAENPPLFVRHFHTPAVTRQLVRIALAMDQPLARRLDLALHHVRIALENLTNVGQGERVLGRSLGLPDSAVVLTPGELDGDLGYQALEDADVDEGRREELLATTDEWLATVALRERAEVRAFTDRVPEGLHDGVEAQLVAEQVRRVREAGYRLVHLVPPRIEPATTIILQDRARVYPTLLNFGTPVTEPELYDLALWYDRSHLTRAGARLFSTKLAARIAALVEEER